MMAMDRLPLVTLLAVLLLPLPLPAAAQIGMSPELHREVQAANELLAAGDSRQAISRLTTLSRRGNLNAYEKAVLQQMLGFAYFETDNSAQAREAFEAALSFHVLPDQITNGVTMALTQVCMNLRDFECARRHVDRVIAAATAPDPDFLAVAAWVYYELKRYDVAERHIRRALDAGEEAKENWYQILLAIYREQEAWGKAEKVLRDAVVRFPDKGTYWQFLSYVQFAQDKHHEALATLMLAWRLDLIEGTDLERISGFHANLGIPEKAARMLAQWLDNGTLDANTERRALLGRLWLLARERDNAIAQLATAADGSNDGDIDLLIGKVHYEVQAWDRAADRLERALAKGGLGDAEAEARLLLGISAYHTGQKNTARAAFEAAGREPRYRDHARYWLNRLQEEG
jgi:tetratricopeptide (TPR) repeat protein